MTPFKLQKKKLFVILVEFFVSKGISPGLNFLIEEDTVIIENCQA